MLRLYRYVLNRREFSVRDARNRSVPLNTTPRHLYGTAELLSQSNLCRLSAKDAYCAMRILAQTWQGLKRRRRSSVVAWDSSLVELIPFVRCRTSVLQTQTKGEKRMRHRKLFVLVLLSSALLVTALLVVGRRASGQDTAKETSNSIARINEKATLLNTGDQTQVREVADEVFKAFDLDQVPDEVISETRDRLIAAEVRYRAGQGKPISEFGVVRMVNMLADSLGAPAYAKTNVFEVRRMEMNFIPWLGKFMSQKAAHNNTDVKRVGASFNPTMSPLEAVTIAGLLIQQKRFNPGFQLTQSEWLAKHYGKRNPKDNLQEARNTQSHEQLDQILQRSTDTMTAKDFIKLSHNALDKLGVPQAEGSANQ
jgi:hypothetical protein